MSRKEWIDRYAARVMFCAEWDKESALASAEAGACAYEDEHGVDPEWSDPEGMADDEIACWTNDGDE